MKKLQTFWYALRKTFTSPSYYEDVIKAPFQFSLKFFLFYFFVLSLIITIFASLALIPFNAALLKFPTSAASAFPKELSVRIKNGTVTTNVKEPYFIPFENFRKLMGDDTIDKTAFKDFQNFIVIDTKANSADFKKYHTVALLTKNHISYIAKDSQIETQSLEDMKNMTINQEFVKKLGTQITSYLPFIYPLLVVLIFAGSFFILSTIKLFYLLFGALLLLAIARIVSYPLSYKKAYQIGLHLILIVSTILGLFSLFSINLNFPFAQSLLLIILGLFVLPQKKKAVR